MKKYLKISMMYVACICFMPFHNIHASEEEPAAIMPFKRLFNTYENSIILCGVKTSQYNKDDLYFRRKQSAEDLLAFAVEGIDFYRQEIQKKNQRILIFSNNKQNNLKYCPVGIYQKNKKGIMETTFSYDHDYELSNGKKNTYIVYNMPWHSSQNSEERIAHEKNICDILLKKDIPCLLLIDNILLYRNNDIEKRLYSIFGNKKRLLTCDPYAQTIRLSYQPPINITDYAVPCVYFLVIGSVYFAFYYNPEVGKYCLSALIHKP